MELWDFTGENPEVPAEADVQTALRKVNGTGIHLNGQTLTFDSADIRLDLGALVKGYAADRLKEYLTAKGASAAVINLGGNVYALGNNNGNPWKVGIQKPFSLRGETLTVVETENRSVVSSGTYERYFEKDGRQYHHIIDARTGYPAVSDLSQVTIVSDSSLEGDLLSTVCFLLGSERGIAYVQSRDDVQAIFVGGQSAILYTDFGN